MKGGYALSGTKICVSQARTAARILVSAQSGEELIVALVDPKAAGVTLNRQEVTAGDTRHELVMNKAQVPAEDIVATGGEARVAMQWALQATRVALAAMALGVCDKMMRITGQYTSEREQFGRAIATFQAVSHRVADCYIDIECSAAGHTAGGLTDRPGSSRRRCRTHGQDLVRRCDPPGQPGIPALPRRHWSRPGLPAVSLLPVGAPDRTDRRQQRALTGELGEASARVLAERDRVRFSP